MRRALRVGIAAGMAGAAGVAGAQTGDQPADILGAIQVGFSNSNSAVSGANRRLADNFTLAEAAVIEQIEWVGIVYNGGTPADIRAFQVLIFSDSNATAGVFGVPDQQIYPAAPAGETPMAAISAVSLGAGPVISMVQQTHYLYSTPTSISLPAGDYWIQISGVMDNTSRAFAWGRHFGDNGDNGHAGKQTGESEWGTSSGDFAWVLTLAAAGGADTDGDGLTDAEEAFYGTDPEDPDTDADGLTDYEEVMVYFTHPLNPDTDGDGLLDGTEIELQVIHACLSPLVADSDGDNLSDGFELLVLGTNPCVVDTDGDGLNDDADPDPYIDLIVDEVLALDLGVFDAPNPNGAAGKRGALANQFGVVLLHIAEEEYGDALDKLQDLSVKIDDWLIDCEERDQLQQYVADLAAVIAALT